MAVQVRFILAVLALALLALQLHAFRALPSALSCKPLVLSSAFIDREATRSMRNDHTALGMFNFLKQAGVSNNAKQAPKKPVLPTVIVQKNYNVAIGALVIAALLTLLAQNLVAGGAFGVIGAFLALQTGKVRFVFDDEAVEVLVAKGGKEESASQLEKSRDNFAVGGRNRWAYNSITEWFFLPSAAFPVLMYFNEQQTNGPDKGQLHLFPVIMNSKQLEDLMTTRIGPSGKKK